MIKVLIERTIAEGLEEFYEKAIGNLLTEMTSFDGYISSDSMVELHQPNRYFVGARWEDEESWNRWFVSHQRQQLVAALVPFLQSEEKYTLLAQIGHVHNRNFG